MSSSISRVRVTYTIGPNEFDYTVIYKTGPDEQNNARMYVACYQRHPTTTRLEVTEGGVTKRLR